MARADDIGMFWEDLPATRTRGGARVLGPMPSIPETGWRPVVDLPEIRNAPWIGIDVETYDPELQDKGPGWARGVGHICGISIAVPKQSAHGNVSLSEGSGDEPPVDKYYFPLRHEVQPELNMDYERVMSWLKYSLSNNQPKIGANLLYDIGWLAHEGVAVNGNLYDCQYAEGLLDEEGRLSLEEIGWKYLRRGKTADVLEEWIMSYYMPPQKYWRREIYRSPVTLTGPYAEDDAAMPYLILRKQWRELNSRGLMDLFEMECKLIRLLIAMRFAGITVDVEYAEQLKADFLQRADEIHKNLEYTAGVNININAADSIARAFDKHNLPYGRTRTGRPSFTADYLKTIKHPVAQLITEERKLRKLISTFIDGYVLESHINGKVYASFHPMASEYGGARSGRFSSSNPNLQNIPIRTPEGRLLRGLFTFDKGHVRYRSGDYSQVEYRLLAHYAVGKGSEEVRREYNENPHLDYHRMIGAMIKSFMGVDYIREIIKTLNFALVYGVGRDHLAEMLGVDATKGKEISATFHKAVPFARATMGETADEVAKTGICTTILGRQSHFDMWEPDDYRTNPAFNHPLPYDQAVQKWGPAVRRAYLYAALNYRLQGSAADIMKKAMVDCWENGVFAMTGVPRLTVHDELGFSDRGGVPEDAWEELVHTMEHTIKLNVPLRFDFKAGKNWLECK